MISKIFKIIRLHIVAGGLVAFSLGVLLAMLAGARPNPTIVVLVYLVVFSGDLSTHYSNDYFDARVESDGQQRKAFGGSNILFKYPQMRPVSRLVAIALMSLSIMLAVASVLWYGVPSEFLMIAVGANLLGWFYSAPPLRLLSRGLGEIAIAIGTGFVIPGAGYLAARGKLDSFILPLTIPFIMYGFILSLSLEIPDMEDDLKVGKTNLVVRKGRQFAFVTIAFLSSLATIAFLVVAKSAAPPTSIHLGVFTVFSLIPLAAGAAGSLQKPQIRSETTRFSTANNVSLFIFNILTNIYLLVLILLRK
ncbi:MAG: prenyltransferase [archaeon]